MGETNMYRFQHKLKYVKQKIKTWNKEVLGNISEVKSQLEKEMELLQREII